jgi:hypothetical protein
VSEPGVLLDVRASPATEAIAKVGIPGQLLESTRELSFVAGFHEQRCASMLEDFPDLPEAAGRDRPTCGHVLE